MDSGATCFSSVSDEQVITKLFWIFLVLRDVSIELAFILELTSHYLVLHIVTHYKVIVTEGRITHGGLIYKSSLNGTCSV